MTRRISDVSLSLFLGVFAPLREPAFKLLARAPH